MFPMIAYGHRTPEHVTRASFASSEPEARERCESPVQPRLACERLDTHAHHSVQPTTTDVERLTTSSDINYQRMPPSPLLPIPSRTPSPLLPILERPQHYSVDFSPTSILSVLKLAATLAPAAPQRGGQGVHLGRRIDRHRTRGESQNVQQHGRPHLK